MIETNYLKLKKFEADDNFDYEVLNENWDAVDGVVSRQNLFDNSNFTNPINQRSVTTWYNDRYGIDRWKTSSTSTAVVESDGITFTSTNANTLAYQIIEDPTRFHGKTLTASFGTSVGTLTMTVTIPNAVPTGTNFTAFGTEVGGVRPYCIYETNGRMYFALTSTSTNGVSVKAYWAKLEEGDRMTPWHADSYYAEYIRCARYYVRRTGVNSQSILLGAVTGSGYADFTFYFPTKMRTKPTISYSNVSIAVAGVAKGFKAVGPTRMGHEDFIQVVAYLDNSATAGYCANMYVTASTGYIDFSADL